MNLLSKTLLSVAAIAATCWVGSEIYRCVPISHPPGRLPLTGPEQENIAEGRAKRWQLPDNGPWITPLARYKIQAVVLSTSPYKKSYDDGAVASAWDIAVAWGPVADSRVLEAVRPRQFGRFVFWNYPAPEQQALVAKLLANTEEPPLSVPTMLERHIANIHVICDDAMKNRIHSLRTGTIVTLRGDLIQVEVPGMRPWRSSLVRTDTGNGACEIMHLRSLSIP